MVLLELVIEVLNQVNSLCPALLVRLWIVHEESLAAKLFKVRDGAWWGVNRLGVRDASEK